MPNLFQNLAPLGDSVVWGQGLLKEQKYFSLVAASLNVNPANIIQGLAHSGADIGRGQTKTGSLCHGEVPTGIPTIFQMLQSVPGKFPPKTLVLLSGGINDLGVERIVNPITSKSDIRRMTDQFCRVDMMALIGAVLTKLSDQDSRIVVTNYFPILSEDSVNDVGIDRLLNLQRLTVGTHVSFNLPGMTRSFIVSQVVDQCLLFWRESNTALNAAVRTFASGQVLFADNGFKEENAMFATRPLIFSPLQTDPMEAERRGICNACENNIFKLPFCLKAATGHPNVAGATAYARAIGRALNA